MEIIGKITGIKYNPKLIDNLNEVIFKDFDINTSPSSFLLKIRNNTFAISKWVSPKRTRSYPFERIYNTLNISRKITIIPIVKDEGAKGDRDFIQWDTISLMSLLDVFVIFAYYETAEVKNGKITNQKFNNKYIITKIKEIENYHSSALHWNLNELNTNLHKIIDKVKKSYKNIEQNTNIKLHNFDGLDNFKTRIGEDVSLFMEFSRDKAGKAQTREFNTQQPKESLSTLSKAKITITNYLGGKYYLTVDEIKVSKDKILLIEGKHTKNEILPSKSDIKDGLIKMILYSNLNNVSFEDNTYQSLAVLNLTSNKLKSEINSKSSVIEINKFIELNNLNEKQKAVINIIFEEANKNNFLIKIQHSK